MPDSKQVFKIFYAWQSDLDAKFNRNAIKKSLRVASAELEEQLSSKNPTEIVIDEATRDSPGSPNIPKLILEKIQGADVFVADVSIINGKNADGRSTPNPNVVFELGFAVANLGWERVILLVNEVHGTVELLPFDFDRHRAMTFKLAEGVGTQKELAAGVTAAISLILVKDPAKPKIISFDLSQTQRERDLVNLRRLLGSIHWPIVQEHIAIGPKYVTMQSDHFHEEVTEILSSPLFHIYDAELRECVDTFFRHWSESIKYDQYDLMRNGIRYIWHPGPRSQRFRETLELREMESARLEMESAMEHLLKVIRTKFPEIDLQELSEATARRYNSEIQDIQRRLGNKTVKNPEKKQ
jgi:hypothetical protein